MSLDLYLVCNECGESVLLGWWSRNGIMFGILLEEDNPAMGELGGFLEMHWRHSVDTRNPFRVEVEEDLE